VTSLAVALVGMFTFIGSLAAIGLGILAIKTIRQSKKLDGLNIARAGIIAGGVGIFLTAATLIVPFGLDVFYRELAFLGRITYGNGGSIESPSQEIVIKRPAAGRWATFENNTQNIQVDDLIAVNVSADAYMACQHVARELNDDEESIQKKVLDRVRKSQLVNMLGRLNGNAAPEGTIVAQKKIDDGVFETTLDMRLGGIERRLLILYKTKNRLRVEIFVGCARKSRFERMQDEFRDAFSGYTNKL
jgi:hypothetical protein